MIAKRFIESHWTFPLYQKTLVWSQKTRVFCDGGNPKFEWLPKVRRKRYAKHWGMVGFVISLWGREINFSFGVDSNNLYPKAGLR